MKKASRLIVIAGPTAVGKTSYSLHLARKLNAAIISADSRQVYKELKIGTARIEDEEMQGIPHYMVGNVSIKKDFDVARYESEVIDLLEKLFYEKQYAILVGGTGLYIKAVIEGLDKFPEVSREIRDKRETEYRESGLKKMIEELRVKDPAYYKKVDKSNPARVIRAISVIDASDRPFSDFLDQPKSPRNFGVRAAWLNLPKAILHEHIEIRVHQMIDEGLLNEVQNLSKMKSSQALQTVGYKELFDHIKGNLSLEEAVEQIITHTKQYAKRQVTWFKKYIPGPEMDARNWDLLDEYFLGD